MRHSIPLSGALAPRGHAQEMPLTNAHWHLGRNLCKTVLPQPLREHALRHLAPALLSRNPQPAFCSALLHHSSSSRPSYPLSQPDRAAASTPAQQLASFSACKAGSRTHSGDMSSGSHRALTSSSFAGLELAAFSGQHGLRRSVRLKAISEHGHCGEDGLVKGAGVVCLLFVSYIAPHVHSMVPLAVGFCLVLCNPAVMVFCTVISSGCHDTEPCVNCICQWSSALISSSITQR